MQESGMLSRDLRDLGTWRRGGGRSSIRALLPPGVVLDRSSQVIGFACFTPVFVVGHEPLQLGVATSLTFPASASHRVRGRPPRVRHEPKDGATESGLARHAQAVRGWLPVAAVMDIHKQHCIAPTRNRTRSIDKEPDDPGSVFRYVTLQPLSQIGVPPHQVNSLVLAMHVGGDETSPRWAPEEPVQSRPEELHRDSPNACPFMIAEDLDLDRPIGDAEGVVRQSLRRVGVDHHTRTTP